MVNHNHLQLIDKYLHLLPTPRHAVFLGDQRPSNATGHVTLATLCNSRGFDSYLDIDYNGNAKLNHNLNEPVPASLHNTADLIFDGGTIEHVCNVGAALASMAAMMKVGGIIIQESPIYPYGQAYYGIDPQVQRDFFAANGFMMLEQILSYENSIRMKILHAVCRVLPREKLFHVAALLRRKAPIAKGFLFNDRPQCYKVYKDNYEDKECYYLHPQTRTMYVGRKVMNTPITWPAMRCYPPAP